MNRSNDERVSRVQRHRTEEEAESFYTADATAPRRRRSQAARIQAEIEETRDNYIPRAQLESASSRTQRAASGARQPTDAKRRADERPATGVRQAAARPAKQPKVKQSPYAPNGRYVDPYDDDFDDEAFDDGLEEAFDDAYDDDDAYDEAPEKRHVLRWVIIVTLLVALLGGATFIGLNHPEWIGAVVEKGRALFGAAAPTVEPTEEPTVAPTPMPEPVLNKDAAAVISFMASTVEQPDIEEPIQFTVTTTRETDRVQIVDNNEQVLVEGGEGDYADTDYARVWNLMYYFPEPYEGKVEARSGNEAGWSETVSTETLSVGIAATSVDVNALAGGMDGQMLGLSAGTDATIVTTAGTVYDSAGPIESFSRENPINFVGTDAYFGDQRMNGMLTFRGSNLRQNSAYGSVAPEEKKLVSLWNENVGVASENMATWNAQPLIIQWHKNIREIMPIADDMLQQNSLKEVVFAANDGNLYFFDLDTGLATREPVAADTSLPMLGAVSAHPKGFPLLYAGLGDPDSNATDSGNSMYVFNMLTHGMAGKITGGKLGALSSDTTFITSPLVDPDTDTLITVGGDGLLYTYALNTTLDIENKQLTFVKPSGNYLQSIVADEDTAVFSSPAAEDGTVYYATRGGIVQAVNLNTLMPEWAVDVGDETDAALALDIAADGDVAVYTATSGGASGVSTIRRLNGASGETEWSVSVRGSIQASPLVGDESISDLVFFASVNASNLYALDKNTGDLVWQFALSGSKASSPMALYDEQGNAYIVQGDGGGLFLLDGETGEQLDYLALDGAPIGSPAAFNNTITVATDAGKLYALMIH